MTDGFYQLWETYRTQNQAGSQMTIGSEWFGGKNKMFVDVGEGLPTNAEISKIWEIRSVLLFGTMLEFSRTRKVGNRKSSVSSSLGRFGAWEYHHSIRVKILDRLSLSELFQLTHTGLPHASTLGPNPGIENRLYLLP